MYCKNCGKQLDENSNFCPHCGAETEKVAAESTVEPVKPAQTVKEGRDWLVSLILCIFLGCLGLHSFYNGKTGIGIAQILTCGGCGIWTLIDMIMIITDNYKDCDGKALVHKI